MCSEILFLIADVVRYLTPLFQLHRARSRKKWSPMRQGYPPACVTVDSHSTLLSNLK